MAPETISYGYLITARYRMLIMTFKIWPMVDIFMELPINLQIKNVHTYLCIDTLTTDKHTIN